MPDLTFVTGNSQKFKIAEKVFATHGITLLQASYDIDEIQAEDAEKIVIDKINKAYALTGQPVLVNDDSWAFLGLKGFPGPYMKSILHWFTAEDFINLTKHLSDRRFVLTQWIAYQDDHTQKLIKREHRGEILPEARGSFGNALQKVITVPGDNGLSISETYESGKDPAKREVADGWREFVTWYKEYTA